MKGHEVSSDSGRPELGKVLGLSQTVGIAIGTTIGAGVFTYTSIAARFAGPALPLAYALAVIPVAFALAPIAMMGAAIPTVGGTYKYPSRLLSPGVAFVGVWCYMLGAFFGYFPLYALTCVDYIAEYVPQLAPAAGDGSSGVWHLVVAAGILTIFYIVNLVGVSPAATVEAVLVAVLLSALLLFPIAGLPQVESSRFDDLMGQGTAGIATGASLLTFAYLGSNAVIELGGEIRDPGRTIPRAFAIAIPVVLVVYLGVSIVTVGAADWRVVAGLASDPPGTPLPLTVVARTFLGSGGLAFFVIGGALVAIATSINACFLWGTRSLLVLCSDQLLPRWLGKLHPRFKTPSRLLTAVWLLSLLGLVLPISREVLASYATVSGLCIFVPVLITAMLLPRRCPEEYRASAFKLRGIALFFCPIVGILLCLGAMVDLLTSQRSFMPLLVFMIWTVVGVAYYLWARARRPAIRELLGKKDWGRY